MGIFSRGRYNLSYPNRLMMAFIDGENLTFNFQSVLNSNANLLPQNGVIHKQDTYVWHPMSIKNDHHEVLRASYYTFAVGDDQKQKEICDEIRALSFIKTGLSAVPCNLRPLVFKKNKQGQKSKGVDIKMTVDILTNVYNDNVDTVLLITGDGDFLPIIQEVSHAGKQIFLASFRSGLNKQLINYVDHYYELDNSYFTKKADDVQ